MFGEEVSTPVCGELDYGHRHYILRTYTQVVHTGRIVRLLKY